MSEIAGSRDRRTDNIRRSKKRNSSLFTLLCACMHFVCALYASPTAYIFVPSALLLSQTVFLYALYAVNSGVVSSHSMHSELFDAYNAYKSGTHGLDVKFFLMEKENTMQNVNLYRLMSELYARPEVRTADIVSWEGTIKTVMRDGTVVAIGVQDEYPAVALYTIYANDEDYRNKEPLTEGLYYDFEDDHGYKDGVEAIIKEAC